MAGQGRMALACRCAFSDVCVEIENNRKQSRSAALFAETVQPKMIIEQLHRLTSEIKVQPNGVLEESMCMKCKLRIDDDSLFGVEVVESELWAQIRLSTSFHFCPVGLSVPSCRTVVHVEHKSVVIHWIMEYYVMDSTSLT